MQRKERNKQINADFAIFYKSSIETYGRATYGGIYYALSKKYALSEMQVRRIIKGYNNKIKTTPKLTNDRQ